MSYKQKWISCKDELPDEGIIVLFAMKNQCWKLPMLGEYCEEWIGKK